MKNSTAQFLTTQLVGDLSDTLNTLELNLHEQGFVKKSHALRLVGGRQAEENSKGGPSF